MPIEHGLRASDDDRRRVVSQLEAHTAAGRLDLDEFAERVDRALSARTHIELAEVTRDLPAEADRGGPQSRQLFIAFALAALALVVLAVAFALGHH